MSAKVPNLNTPDVARHRGSEGRTDGVEFVGGPSEVVAALRRLGLEGERPVVVLIGGADQLSPTDGEIVRGLLDRGVLPVAADAQAVIVSGGTDAGVMRILGDLARGWPGLDLLGVAPASQVRDKSQGLVPGDVRVPLDSNHGRFLLTAGETWGSETAVLLAVAKALAGDVAQGVVLLANGGAIAKDEASWFLAAGWPVLVLDGTGRTANDLAKAVRSRRSRRAQWREAAGTTRHVRDGWEDLAAADVEIHRVRKDPVELLGRRLQWRLSPDLITRAAWSRYGSYDAAAQAEHAWTQRFQGLLALGALLLAGLGVAFGRYNLHSLKWVLLALPLALAVGSTLADALVPARNWLALRQSAQAVQHAIYRRHAAVLKGTPAADETLVGVLGEVDRLLLHAGVPLGVVVETIGRPAALPRAFDEFASLTPVAYFTERLGGQLRYYRGTAQKLRRRELLAVGSSALLAGGATVAASEVSAAIWMPILVLAASTIVILRQRARWQDKVNLCGSAIAELEAIRTRAISPRTRTCNVRNSPEVALADVVLEVEQVLELENAAWNQTMRRSLLDAGRYQQPTALGAS